MPASTHTCEKKQKNKKTKKKKEKEKKKGKKKEDTTSPSLARSPKLGMLCITAYSASSANVCTDTKLQSLLRGRVGPKSFSLPTVDLTVPTSHCWYWPSACIDRQSSEAPAAPYLNSCRLCSLQITLMLRLDPHADPGKDMMNVCPWDFMLRLNPPENSTCCGRNLKTSVEKIGGKSKKKGPSTGDVLDLHA